MARWTEERERWMGRRDPYGGEERRFGEQGEEGGMRSRDWRDEDRYRDWRLGERSGERGEWSPAERERRGWREGFGREPFRSGEQYGGERGEGYGFPYSRSEYPSAYGREYPYGGFRYGREDERGTFERMGDRIKEGVRKLTGRGPKGYRRSDERIRDEVSERIARSWVNAEEVEVTVQNGEVTLTGFVESREDKRTLEDVADDVFGVDEVHNEVRVRRGERFGAGAAATTGTGTTGTGAAMSAQQSGGRSGQQPGQAGRH